MKGLGPRSYNVLFHTHTVSGIVISAVLFVIFFAGAVSLYKQEIYQWEDPSSRGAVREQIGYERLIVRLDSLKKGVNAADEIRIVMPTEARPIYTIYAPVAQQGVVDYATFTYNPITDGVTELFTGRGSTVGDTLYRLHFLDQIPFYIGRYIAGFVALFFAFAVITGILIHWRNIISKFYGFSFKQLRKQFWTNAHTVFGVIGLPFQLMYAITGAFYMLSVFILAPAVMMLFNGNQDKLVEKIYPSEAFHKHDAKESGSGHMKVAAGVEQIRSDHKGYSISYLEFINPGKENAVLGAELADPLHFNSNGMVVIDLHSGKYKLHLKPGDKNYAASVLGGISKLHFASFGGWLIKALYFILSMFTCFVIISGVLMWKEARNKPSYTDRQRTFHHRVTMIYLSGCFSLFPATALLFIAEQVVPLGDSHASTVNTVFFTGWLIMAVVSYFLKDERKLTFFALVLGGVLGIMVPLTNGFTTGDWLWDTVSRLSYVFITDLSWFCTGIFGLWLAISIRLRSWPS